MTGALPTNIDLSPFVGQELLSFVVGKHHIELVLTDTRVVIEGGFEIKQYQSGTSTFSRTEMLNGISKLTALLGQIITGVVWADKQGFALQFSNQMTFIACANRDGFESFSFSVPNEPGIIVV